MKSKTVLEIEAEIESIKKDIVKSYEPNTKWQQWNAQRQHDLMNEQINAAAKRGDSRFFEAGYKIDKAIRDNETAINKTLFPLFNSSISMERSRGEHFDNKARPLVNDMKSIEMLRREYNDAMTRMETDYATRLLDAAENKWNLPNEKALIEELKKNHVESLQLNDMLIEKSQLKDLKKLFDRTKKMWSVGLLKPNAKENRDNYTRMLIDANLAV